MLLVPGGLSWLDERTGECMKRKRGFQNEPLKDMVAVGAVGPDRARLWIRSDRSGTLLVRCWKKGEAERADKAAVEVREEDERDNTCSIDLPAPAGRERPLIPMSRYAYRVSHSSDGHVIGEGGFETAPADDHGTPPRFSIALMSCNQPFTATGGVEEKAVQMLRAARRCMEEHNTRLAFMVGDQMYSDYPKSLSLFDPDYFQLIAPPGRKSIQDCSPQEVRRIYQSRYRHFWNLSDLKAIQSEIPCYLILDDHEIVDNWGSAPEHKEPEWQSVGKGALMAYNDYQASRVLPIGDKLPTDFHYSVTYGHTAVFVMDIRSDRRAGIGGQLYSDAQEGDLRQFLRENRTKEILLIVLSVPVVHMPQRLARFVARLPPTDEDFSDRWSTGAHAKDRDRFLKIIHDHQVLHREQRMILLSGDIHIGCVHEILWHDGAPVLYQVISSGITHSPGFLIQTGSALSIRLNRHIATMDGSLSAAVRLFRGTHGHKKNPFASLNLGIIEIETPSPEARPKIRFLLYGHKGERPFCAYRSPEV